MVEQLNFRLIPHQIQPEDDKSRAQLLAQSSENFRQAGQMAENFDSPTYKRDFYAADGISRGKAGLDIEERVKFLTANNLPVAAAGVLLAGKQFDRAYQAIDKLEIDKFWRLPLKLRLLAELNSHGDRDQTRTLAQTVLKETTNYLSRHRTNRDGLLASASGVYADLGLGKDMLLTFTDQLLKDKERWSVGYLSNLAASYAYWGELDKALVITGLDWLKPSYYKDHLVREIAQISLDKKDKAGVRRALDYTDSHLLKGVLLANLAADLAPTGAAVDGLIDETIDVVDKSIASVDYNSERLEILAILGRACCLSGGDGKPLFTQSLQAIEALDKDDYEMLRVFDGVAKNLALAGFDGEEVWRKGYSWLDKYVPRQSQNSAYFYFDMSYGLQMINLEDIAKTQLECGYYNLVRESLDRLVKHGKVYGNNSEYDALTCAKLISEMAAMQALRGRIRLTG